MLNLEPRPHLCHWMDMYDLDENSLAQEIAGKTLLGQAILTLREGEPLDVSTYAHLTNAGIDPEELYGAYV